MHCATRRAAAALTLFASLFGVYACSDGPSEPPAQGLVAASIQLAQAPTPTWSGEATTLTLRVLAKDGQPLANASVTLEPQHGTVTQPTVATDAQGLLVVTWQLADEDRRQVLRAGSGPVSLEIPVNSVPHITALLMAGLPAMLALGDTSPAVTTRGRTSTGREVAYPSAWTLTPIDAVSVYPELEVAAVLGHRVRATGPGTLQVRATSGTLISDVATLHVPAGRPIVLRLTPSGLPAAGGPVTIEGYDLGGVTADAVTLDGEAVPLRSVSATALTIDVPPGTPQCSGRDALALAVADAYVPAGPLRLRREREGTLALAPGVVHALGRTAALCLKLRGEPGAEYVLGYFDPRGIDSGNAGYEDYMLAYQGGRVRVLDRSIAGAATAAPIRSAGAASAHPRDVVRLEAGAMVSTGVDWKDLWYERRTPWAVGDTFALRNDQDGSPTPGIIRWVSGRFAVGTMVRDDAHRIPERIRNVLPVLEEFSTHQAAFLGDVFGTDWPVTTVGSNQTLIVIGDFFAPGLTFLGNGTVDRGMFIGVDPGVAELPPDQPLYFAENVLFHEMAHAYQDRYAMQRCALLGDCGYDPWYHRWAIEGGADYLTLEMMRRQLGYQLTGNYSLEGPVANTTGVLTAYGDWLGPHYIFTEGYASSSWFLLDIVQRAVAAGVPHATAAAAVARGSFEGWYGHGQDGTQRPGLVARVRALLGTGWEPLPAALRALLSIGADDRSPEPSLQAPFTRDTWLWIRPGASFQLNGTGGADLSLVGLSFAHYRVQDAMGLGGTIEAETGTPMEWAIVRLR